MELIMKNEDNDIVLKQLVKERVLKLKRFYTHLLLYAIGLAVYVLKTYFNFPFNFPPLHYLNFTVMAIWTFIMVTDILQLLLQEKLFGAQWEKQKINQILEQEKTTKKTWE